jgi:GT2 family glycosyltransferase/tetratricopeptide (TPR) repeat protein
MSLRYLFGPVTAAFANQYLHRERQAGLCRTFDAAGTTDVALGPGDSWESVCARLDGWRPDYLVLYLPYTTVPAWVWTAPVPLVAVAPDYNLLWHGYRRRLHTVERILTDLPGLEVLARAGIAQARAAHLFACEQAFLDGPWEEVPRDLDILFVGNLHPAVQRERLAWLGRLARLGRRWRVAIRTGVFGEDYRRLLGRTRIVFNRSIRGECNRRVFEAAAAGALLFQEAENREVPVFFRPGQEYVAYTRDNLEDLLEYYLSQEDERQAMAAAARARVREYAFEDVWRAEMARLEEEWPQLVERAGRRARLVGREELLARTWEALGSSDGGDAALVAELTAAVTQAPTEAGLHNALGLAVARADQWQGPLRASAGAVAVNHFRRAVACDPQFVVAELNLAEALVGLGRQCEAIPAARRVLATLERLPQLSAAQLDAGHFPPAYDLFRVEWERAAWTHPGDREGESRAKRELLRWRLHTLLAQLTGELAHYYEAALSRPDLPSTRAALGCALGRAGRFGDALPHLRYAVEHDPFDREAARALAQTLTEVGEGASRRRLARDRYLLAAAAPDAVPVEAWFRDAPPVGDDLASILVLCCNEVEYTRPCLESVLQHTRAPFELVLVDNGSTDDTAAYLEELRTRPGPVRVEILRNGKNVGFPAGCNQALAAARGDHLVLLNNDTVVTEGWLDRLIGWALHDWPTVGLVGAVTNYSRPPQQIPVDYPSLEGLAAFAQRHRRDHAGKALETDRLTGFCLLMRRAVLERIGGFDEGYGLGFFDDDDLSVRARQAGFRLLVAQDVFIHHFGSRPFTGLGVDCREQLHRNFERFKTKWGNAQAAGYQVPAFPSAAAEVLPDAVVIPFPALARPRVSLCMIVKNEEANLAACLGGAADLVDEVIVVDTGSTDRTKEIAAQFGAKVFDFPWCDSFAAARNESLRHATSLFPPARVGPGAAAGRPGD